MNETLRYSVVANVVCIAMVFELEDAIRIAKLFRADVFDDENNWKEVFNYQKWFLEVV